METCPHCGRRCRVPVTMYMPLVVREAYRRAGWDFMCTCEKGAAAEYRRLGACYADVIEDRVHRLDSPRSGHGRAAGA